MKKGPAHLRSDDHLLVPPRSSNNVLEILRLTFSVSPLYNVSLSFFLCLLLPTPALLYSLDLFAIESLETMPRPSSPSIPEKEFLVAALQQSLRLDGRSPVALREPLLSFGPELGWVECAMDKTR